MAVAQEKAFGPVPNPDFEVRIEPWVRQWNDRERVDNANEQAVNSILFRGL